MRQGTNVQPSNEEAQQAAEAILSVLTTGAPTEQKPAFQPTLSLANNAPVRGQGRRFKKNWFLDRSDDLAVVTDEPYNEDLGILQVQIQQPTDKQKAAGIICKVAMESKTGWDFGITVWESKQNPGDIMLMVGGAREIKPKEGQELDANGQKKKPEMIRDRRLSDPATAQILSYVWKLLVPVQA